MEGKILNNVFEGIIMFCKNWIYVSLGFNSLIKKIFTNN
jgi:hypothetical protein